MAITNPDKNIDCYWEYSYPTHTWHRSSEYPQIGWFERNVEPWIIDSNL